jgi:AcrR family transcriptional regulator
VRAFDSWDWRALTVRSVAEHAGVAERTVYRHFANQRDLHDAVMRQLADDAGVSYEGLTLAELPNVMERVVASLPTFSAMPRPKSLTETFRNEDAARRDGILDAVQAAEPPLDDRQRRLVAATLDVLWDVPAYQRMVAGWRLTDEEATAAIRWAIEHLVEAIESGEGPPVPDPS